jgi:hypothetical protein
MRSSAGRPPPPASSRRRVGETKLFDTEVFNAWGDVQNNLEFWAATAVYRLCVVRGGANCVRLKA